MPVLLPLPLRHRRQRRSHARARPPPPPAPATVHSSSFQQLPEPRARTPPTPKAAAIPSEGKVRASGSQSLEARTKPEALHGETTTSGSWRTSPSPGSLRACPGRLLAEAKLRAPRRSARCSSLGLRREAGARHPPRASQQMQYGARARRRQPVFPRSPEPLPREDEAAQKKVGLVPPPGEKQRASRR